MNMNQKGAIQSRRKTFQFQPDADKIERTPLAFEQRKEFMHGVSDNDLCNYIMQEANKCQGERMEDLKEMEREYQNMQQNIDQFIGAANALDQNAAQIRTQQVRAQEQYDAMKQSVQAKKEKIAEANEQLNDLNKLLTTMNEHKARFAKAVDEKALKDIRAALGAGSQCAQVQRDILDRITQFATNKSDNSYGGPQGAEIFSTVEMFGQAIKRADPSIHEKQWIQKVAQEVNMDTEQQKGSLLAQVTQPGNATQLLPFFNLFKIVFKFAQIGMTLKTKQNVSRKQETLKKELDDALVEIETQDAFIKNLSFADRIQAEADRIRNNDVAVLVNKKKILEHNINEYRENYGNPINFNKNYFDL